MLLKAKSVLLLILFMLVGCAAVQPDALTDRGGWVFREHSCSTARISAKRSRSFGQNLENQARGPLSSLFMGIKNR